MMSTTPSFRLTLLSKLRLPSPLARGAQRDRCAVSEADALPVDATTTSTLTSATVVEPPGPLLSAPSSGNFRPEEIPRYVERNLPFSQSRNKVAVYHNQGFRIGRLVRHDLFHILLRLKLYISLTMLLFVWTVAVVLFAALYLGIDRRDVDTTCSLFGVNGPINFHGAFAFSLQTTTTVGYTLPAGSNAFFEHCPSLQTLIYAQSVWSSFFNAFLLAFLYSRVARAESRTAQVLFSDKAIVSVVSQPGHTADPTDSSGNGTAAAISSSSPTSPSAATPALSQQVRFQVRVYDVDAKHPVVEARCRMYAVLRNRAVPRPLRLLQPNDEVGAPLFLSLPSVISHHIDPYSALHPPSTLPVATAGLNLRQVDSLISNREEVCCPICGESYGTHQRFVNHVNQHVRNETAFNYPIEGTHRSLTPELLLPPPQPSLSELQTYFQQSVAEIIVTVSGQDPLTSGSFQALQSYRCEDIVWDAGAVFHPCIVADYDAESMRVDLDRFHQVDDAAYLTTQSERSRQHCTSHSLRASDQFFAGYDTPAPPPSQ